MQYLGYTYTENLLTIYLRLKGNWAPVLLFGESAALCFVYLRAPGKVHVAPQVSG